MSDFLELLLQKAKGATQGLTDRLLEPRLVESSYFPSGMVEPGRNIQPEPIASKLTAPPAEVKRPAKHYKIEPRTYDAIRSRVPKENQAAFLKLAEWESSGGYQTENINPPDEYSVGPFHMNLLARSDRGGIDPSHVDYISEEDARDPEKVVDYLIKFFDRHATSEGVPFIEAMGHHNPGAFDYYVEMLKGANEGQFVKGE